LTFRLCAEKESTVKTKSKVTGVLPPDVTEADKNYLSYKIKQSQPVEYLTFYKSNRFGWCVATLPINGKGRTYGMSTEGAIVTMGGRPDDVKVRIYVHDGNRKRLQKYVDLRAKGLGKAGDIRDRIGSRRAQGQEMRAQGRYSWTWDS
jgi:hypothetical protein